MRQAVSKFKFVKVIFDSAIKNVKKQTGDCVNAISNVRN